MNMQYVDSSLLILAFNRPQCTEALVNCLLDYSFKSIFINIDGPRVPSEAFLTEMTFSILSRLRGNTSQFYVNKNKSNRGCKTSCITALTFAFENSNELIVLEDDCIPSDSFFKHVELGLELSRKSTSIAHISGSNLVANITNADKPYLSRYINNWGWAMTSEWFSKIYPGMLWLADINRRLASSRTFNSLSMPQRNYLIEIFKHSVCSATIWDFYIQYGLFENSAYSLIPHTNLVRNIGFGSDATHMNRYSKSNPNYVLNNPPSQLPIDNKFYSSELVVPNDIHDYTHLCKLWNFSLLGYARLKLGNIKRFISF